MRILFLTNAFPDFESSYRGVFIKEMAHLLSKEGFKVSIVTPKIYRRSKPFEKKNGIKVYRFPFFARDKLLIEYKKIPYLRMLLYFISGFLFTLYAAFKNQCHLIHVHWAIPTGLIGVWAGWLLRKPVIVTIHGSDFRMATERTSLLSKIFLYVCQQATSLTCVSDVQAKEIKKMGIGAGKISTFPMGVDESFLKAGRNRREKFNGESSTVLSNRNLLPIYNLSMLIRAIPLVVKEESKVKFLIAGDGSEREKLERDVRSLKIDGNVQFLGRIPHETMPSLLGQTDIYVSTSFYDGTSVSLLEALVSGAFPVVTDIPPNREWIKDGQNGLLFPVNDEYDLAKKIIDALHNQPAVKKRREENIRMISEKVLWSVCIGKIKGIYEAL